jgi:hypothetical protein
MTTKRSGGKITGLLALTMEAQVATDVGDFVQIVGDYEVGLANGTKPVLGHVSVSNKKRVSNVMGTSVGNDKVPGDVTVEARGLYVKRVLAGGAFAAGVEVGVGAANTVVAAGANVATIGISLMASTGSGDDVDILVR